MDQGPKTTGGFFSSPSNTIWVSVVQFIIGLVLYILSYSIFNSVAGGWNEDEYGSAAVAKIEVSMILLPIGLICWQQPLFRFSTYPGLQMLGVVIVLASFIVASITMGVIMYIRWGVQKWLNWNLNFDHPIRMIQGIYLALTLWLTAITLFCILSRFVFQSTLLKQSREPSSDFKPLLNESETTGIQEREKDLLRNRNRTSLLEQLTEISGIILFFWVLIPLLMWVNCVLTSDWHRLDPNTVDYKLATWSKKDDWTAYYSYTCEYETSFDTDTNLTCYARLYYDIQIYFEFIFVVSMFSYIVTKFPQARLFVRRRVSFPCFRPFSQFNVFPNSMTIGEICFWFIWFWMMFTIGYYFVAVHRYDDTTEKTTKEVWARYIGILSMQFMCFGIFSVTRIRLWHDCFQVSFEHLVAYHRFFSYCMIWTAYLHTILWIVWFESEGSDPYSYDDNEPFGSLPFSYHGSNWTVSIMYQFMIVFVPIFYGVCSFWMIRRKYFELFYYTHLFAAVVTITLTLWHATQSWRYMIAPLALYAVDRMIRMYRSSQLCQCVELTTNVGSSGNAEVEMPPGCQATKLTFRVAKFGRNGEDSRFGRMDFKMGQYCFVNISNVSMYEWHPYTIASGEGAKETVLYIKNMQTDGSSCWSSNLYDIANERIPIQDVEIHVDGPYGKEFQYEEYERVVLVAGGIGVTPCHSIFDTLLDLALSDEPVPYVDMIWVSRHPNQASMFLNTWRKYEQNLRLNRFSFRLFVTRVDQEQSSFQNVVPGTNIMFTTGRPEWGRVLRTLIEGDENVSPGKSMVFACGPVEMVNEVENVSVDIGTQFYSESFEF